MQTSKIFKTAWLFAVMSIAGWTTAQAQPVVYNATWTGPTSGGDWNTASSWSTGVIPGSDGNGITNAVIPFISTSSSNIVTYGSAMTATGFGGLTNFGVLIVSAGGFTNNGIFLDAPRNYPGWLFETNPAAVININGNLAVTSNNIVNLGGGATMTIQGSLLLGCGVSAGTGSGNSGSIGVMTNSGGFLSASVTTINPVNSAGPSSTSQSSLLVISGGTNNLGITTVKRSNAGSGGPQTLGTEGLIIYNGLVTMTNLNVGGASGNSWETTLIAGGTVTNDGYVLINNGTVARPSRLFQTGGLFVVPDPGVVNLNPTVAGALTAVYSIQGGTNIIGGLYIGATNGTVVANTTFTNAATIYVGSQGIATNGIVSFINDLKAGGMFGATAPWTGSAPMNMLGTGSFTFQTADMAGNPNNITLATSGVLGGPGSCILNVTGGGTLTLGASNTYAGATLIKGGTLALGASGSLVSTPVIVGPGTTFDVSAVTGGFVLGNGQTLSGSGVVTGAVFVASGATIDPGSNTLTGTLTFSNSVAETNGAINHFDLSGAPNPNNDLLVIGGDLNVNFGGTNTVDISGSSLVSGTNYILIQYGGNFIGGITNFRVTTAVGTLSNDPVAKTISFIPQTTLRGPTNIVWIGNPVNTNWDNEVTTNWLNGTALDFFVPGDSVQFTDAGASNSPVNIVSTVSPASVLVNSQSNYVFASTSGGLITGIASLTVTNTGTLTVLTTNDYTGITTIDGGGALAVASVANNNSPSPVGKNDNLVINNGTFIYSGPTASIDRGATLGNASSAINISANGNLTLNGLLGGVGGLTKTGLGALILPNGNSYAGGTFVNSGILTLNSATAAGTNIITLNGGNLAIGAVKPANTINVAASSSVTGGSTSGLTGIRNVTGSANLLLVVTTSTGVFDLTGDMSTYSGTITFTNAGGTVVRLNGATGSALATWNLGVGPTMDLNVRTGSTNNQLGALEGAVGTTLSGRGGSANNGPSTYVIGANGQSTVFAGVIQNGSGGSSSTTAITKVGTGTLTLQNVSTYTGVTIVSNGVLALSNNPATGTDGNIGNSPSITIEAGAVIDATGEATEPGAWQFANTASQILQGYGTINGGFDASGGSGIVAPGGGISGGIGTLTVSSGVFLGGTTWIKINRAASPNSDLLASSTGFIFYGGTLVVTNIGSPLQVGDTFTLFSSSSLRASFAALDLPGYYTWDTSQLAVNGSIKVTGISSHPSVTKADFSGLAGGAITLDSTNGIPGTTVNVLTSTNVALPFSSWTVLTNTIFDSNGNLEDGNGNPGGLTITNLVNDRPQRFYLLQTLGY